MSKIIIPTIIAILGTFWLWQEPGFEPLISTLVAIATLSGLLVSSTIAKKTKVIQSVPQYLKETSFLFQKNNFIDYNLKYTEAHILGEKMFYLDNQSKSKKLLFMFHGLGLDANDFREYIENSEYRCIAHTLYGFNKNEKVTDILSYQTYCYTLYIFIKENIKNIKPKDVTLIGFSIGADMIQDIIN